VIDLVMVFTMGLLTAGLIALLILPSLSARAERLARRRIEARFPRSMAEVAAERDQLRAELAVDARKVERKLEALAAQHATDLAELGRRAVRVADLERELAERSSALAETIATLAETRSKLEITSEILERTATELHDTGATLSTRDAELSDLQDAHFGLRAQSEERRLMIASLETSVEGLRARVSDLERQTSMLRTTLEDRDRRIIELDTDKSLLEHRISGLQQDREDRDKQLEALRAERAAIVAKLTHALEQASSIEAQHEAETANAAELARRLDVSERQGREALDQLATQLETLRTEKASAEGALFSARAERKALHQEIAKLRHAGAANGSDPGATGAVLLGETEQLAGDGASTIDGGKSAPAPSGVKRSQRITNRTPV
jgi:chromosome segregation ATPase